MSFAWQVFSIQTVVLSAVILRCTGT